MPDILSNRKYYKGGRATGPLRILNFATIGQVAGDGPPIVPLIFGDPVGYSGGFRDIGSNYEAFAGFVFADFSTSTPQIILSWQPVSGLFAGAHTHFHYDKNFTYNDLQSYLLCNKLLITKVTVQIKDIVSYTAKDGYVPSPSGGFFPDNVGIWDGSQNANYFQKISPLTYIGPDNVFLAKNSSSSPKPLRPFFFEMGCEMVLGPQSAFVLDIPRPSSQYVALVTMHAQTFE